MAAISYVRWSGLSIQERFYRVVNVASAVLIRYRRADKFMRISGCQRKVHSVDWRRSARQSNNQDGAATPKPAMSDTNWRLEGVTLSGHTYPCNHGPYKSVITICLSVRAGTPVVRSFQTSFSASIFGRADRRSNALQRTLGEATGTIRSTGAFTIASLVIKLLGGIINMGALLDRRRLVLSLVTGVVDVIAVMDAPCLKNYDNEEELLVEYWKRGYQYS
ncbi:Voltage-dependent calcium channel gamma-3 subunit [Branchiostoma belcheri]|nr:Voltage-dependent calcium channel gamma-3 subunit [Branchiostoma belcheri]